MEIDSEDAQLIDNASEFIIENVSGRFHPIKEQTSCEFSDLGEFVQVPIKDTLGREVKIVLFIAKPENPLPENPIVLIAPGDNETIDDYIQFIDFFIPFGINYCVMDYRGRGYSEGEYITLGDNEIDDVFTVIRYLKENGYSKISYFGRSRGAICGIFAAVEFPELVSVALDSPRIHLGDDDEYISENFNISKEKAHELLPHIYKKVSETIGIDFSRADQPYILAERIRQPIYVIHGESDGNIPVSESRELISILKSEEKELVVFRGGHNSMSRWCVHIPKQFHFIAKHMGVDLSLEDYLEVVKKVGLSQ